MVDASGGTTNVFTIADGGAATFRTQANSSTAFLYPEQCRHKSISI